MSDDQGDGIAFPYKHFVVVKELPRSEMGWPKRNVSRIVLTAWHRCLVEEDGVVAVDPADVARWFMRKRKGRKPWPGHPYHFQINLERGEPVVYQTALLSERTAGLWGWNTRGVHIMIHGDFRYQPPDDLLFYAAACLTADLRGFGISSRSGGHSEASLWLPKKYWTSKHCPGKQFDTEACKKVVSRILIGNETGLPVLPVGEAWWQTR